MRLRNSPPPIALSAILFIVFFLRHPIRQWWYLIGYPKSLKDIYIENAHKGKLLKLFGDEFRVSIPIYKYKEKYYTTYDFEKNKVSGSDTVYVSVSGNDSNNGRSPVLSKQTIESAIKTSAHTIVLLEGHYLAGKNFENGTNLSDINLIGIGKVVVDNNKGLPFVVSGNVFIRNIEFDNGNRGSLRTYIQDNNSICTYIQCKFNNSIVDNEDVGKAQSLGGLRIQGGTHYLYKCEASNNGFDGFSYHAAPDGSSNAPHIVEVDCKAFHNGVNNTYESNNASTAHDGTNIIRLNCVYGFSHGGNVADVHKKTVSFNIGCMSYSVMDLGPEYSKYQANYFCASDAIMYLLDCKSYGSFYDISCWNGGNLFADRIYQKKYDKGGTINMLRR